MTENTVLYGYTAAPSSSGTIGIIGYNEELNAPIVGQTLFFDQSLSDGKIYRCLGKVTDVTTENPTFNDAALVGVYSRKMGSPADNDVKKITMKVQAVYSSATGEPGTWNQAGLMPSSPSSMTPVYIMDEQAMIDLLDTKMFESSYAGTFRGMSGVRMPMLVKGFDGKRGATHQAIIGRSGSGKTGVAQTLTFIQMRNESHAVIVIDPQGQWASESGFVFSLQSAAKALGREVHVLRVSEDIRLPMNKDLLAHLLNELNIWNDFTRMGDENARALSSEVARRIVDNFFSTRMYNIDAREALFAAFAEIAASKAAMGRIYARSGDAGESLKRILCAITSVPFINKKEEEEELDEIEIREGEKTFNQVLRVFTPLINLFSQKNLNGEIRKPLDGDDGFLSKVLKSRTGGEIAPYVILDMSSDTSLNARANYASATGEGSEEQRDLMLMRKMLDNPDIKAHIINTVITSVRDKAEEVYSSSQAMLDTQIIFDEAWRYAPNLSRVEKGSPIAAISRKLADYALDTRKYGLGWTYILQSPRDLHETIWKQLTFIYVGHGMIGGDRAMLSDLIDDSSQLKLYDQFSDPGATGDYPFMGIGPISPLIFTASPVFFNVFNKIEDLLAANSSWIKEICERRGLIDFSRTPKTITLGGFVQKPTTRSTSSSDKSFRGIGTSGVTAKRADGSSISAPPF